MSNNPDLAAEQKFLAHAYDRLESMRRAAQEMMESVLATPKGGKAQGVDKFSLTPADSKVAISTRVLTAA